jgi:hypothetical protein
MPDIIDTRDLLDELRELCGGDEHNPDREIVLGWDDADAVRVEALRELLDEIGDEAQYGVVLIPESEFEDYARELAAGVPADRADVLSWPLNCIDWARAARELAMDYSSVTFDGKDYYCRP